MAEFDRSDEGLVVTGSLDGDSESKLRRHLQVLLDGESDPVTIDLSKVDFISSVCVGSLVAFWVDLRPAGRRMKIAPSTTVRKVLDMTGLSGVFARAASARKPPPKKPSSKHASFDGDEADKPDGESAEGNTPEDKGDPAGDGSEKDSFPWEDS